VLDKEKTGKLGQFPLVTGHSGDVLDVEFNPFNDNIVGSVSEDCYAKIWAIPEGGLKENMNTPVQNLSGHRKKVGTLNFHPTANNIMATSSADSTVKVWDIETGQHRNDIGGHPDIIQSSAWDHQGILYATASKDKKVRLLDPRANSIIGEVEAHPGVKGMRLAFLGSHHFLFTMGFSKTSERQYSLWDPKSLKEPLKTENIDTAAGILMPFFDNDVSMLYLAGKGDGNVRYYEIVDEAPYIHYLSEFKSATPQRGMGWCPKTSMDLNTCEIARLLKITATACEPIHFTVPRKGDIFQDDLYPPTFSGEPSINADQWFGGKNGEIKLVSLAPGFVPAKAQDTSFKIVAVDDTKKQSDKEIREENEKLKKKVAQLEARIKELETQ